MKKQIRFKLNTIPYIVGFCCLIMVIFPEVTAEASKEAISLWLNAIVPTMLPFFFAANFMKEIGLSNRVPTSIYPVVMACLSGYPMGARITGDYYRAGDISKEATYHILSYSMVTGPAFIIGAVGTGFFGSYQAGILIAIGHYLGAGINSIFYRSSWKPQPKSKGPKEIIGSSYYNMLTDAIIDSFKSIAIILAYIIIFMIATDLFQFSGGLTLLTSIFPLGMQPYIAALAKGFIEMTVGCSSLTHGGSYLLLGVTCASFIISFGGLSVLGQSMSMVRVCDIKASILFKIKMTHGVISAIITFFLGSLIL